MAIRRMPSGRVRSFEVADAGVLAIEPGRCHAALLGASSRGQPLHAREDGATPAFFAIIARPVSSGRWFVRANSEGRTAPVCPRVPRVKEWW